MNAVLEIPRAFAALGDPVRLSMVARLANGDQTVSELAAAYPITLQAVSKHVKLLEAAGIVSQTQVGRTRPVRLETAALSATVDWLDAHRRQRETEYERLDELLEQLKGTP
jgi:DNA-binding transcriptional ArsR family regulator